MSEQVGEKKPEVGEGKGMGIGTGIGALVSVLGTGFGIFVRGRREKQQRRREQLKRWRLAVEEAHEAESSMAAGNLDTGEFELITTGGYWDPAVLRSSSEWSEMELELSSLAISRVLNGARESSSEIAGARASVLRDISLLNRGEKVE